MVRHIAHFFIGGIWGVHLRLIWQYLDIGDDIFTKEVFRLAVWYSMIEITTTNVDFAQGLCMYTYM